MKSIKRKFKSVEERVQRLKSLSKKTASFQDYQGSSDTKDRVERNLHVAIETCLDIGKIIISREGLEEPKDNKDIFAVLAKAGILDPKNLSFMVPMAGTRNILIHGYDKIDDSLIYVILKRHTDDFIVFLKNIRDNYLTGRSEGKEEHL